MIRSFDGPVNFAGVRLHRCEDHALNSSAWLFCTLSKSTRTQQPENERNDCYLSHHCDFLVASGAGGSQLDESKESDYFVAEARKALSESQLQFHLAFSRHHSRTMQTSCQMLTDLND
jgi:hypothetical protein